MMMMNNNDSIFQSPYPEFKHCHCKGQLLSISGNWDRVVQALCRCSGEEKSAGWFWLSVSISWDLLDFISSWVHCRHSGHLVDTLASDLWVTERYNNMTSCWLKTIYVLTDFSKQSLGGLKLLPVDTSSWNWREWNEAMTNGDDRGNDNGMVCRSTVIMMVMIEVWHLLNSLFMYSALLNTLYKMF